MCETVTLDRTECRWRGLDVGKVEDALKTGAPHFIMEPTNAKCPMCGVRFKMKPSSNYECCSLSCAAKLMWRRRKT